MAPPICPANAQQPFISGSAPHFNYNPSLHFFASLLVAIVSIGLAAVKEGAVSRYAFPTAIKIFKVMRDKAL